MFAYKQNILKGDFGLNMMYQCVGYNMEVLIKGLCNKCYKNRIFGTDFCDVIREGKPKSNKSEIKLKLSLVLQITFFKQSFFDNFFPN
jgi:hypothetical protein